MTENKNEIKITASIKNKRNLLPDKTAKTSI